MTTRVSRANHRISGKAVPIFVLLSVSCSMATDDGLPPSPAPQRAAQTAEPTVSAELVPGPPPDPKCPTALDQASAHGGAGAEAASFEQYEGIDGAPDLDGDGRDDLILLGQGHKNAEHYFFVDDGECPRLVGVMQGNRLMGFHSTSTPNNGLYDIVMQRTMVHGETEFSTWVFNGERYEKHGRPELGPRPPKFEGRKD